MKHFEYINNEFLPYSHEAKICFEYLNNLDNVIKKKIAFNYFSQHIKISLIKIENFLFTIIENELTKKMYMKIGSKYYNYLFNQCFEIDRKRNIKEYKKTIRFKEFYTRHDYNSGFDVTKHRPTLKNEKKAEKEFIEENLQKIKKVEKEINQKLF